MGWWITAAFAQGEGPVDSAEVQRMVDDLQPKVTAYLGRPPIGPLQSGILSRVEVQVAIATPTPAVGTPAPDLPAVQGRVAENVQLAVYVGQTRGLWVVQEAIDELTAHGGVEPALLRPVMRCLLIHELVHAFQHAYGTVPTDGDPDRLAGWNALREGHATAVELELCAAWEGADIARRVAAIHGIDAPGTLDPGATAAPYAWGRSLVRILDGEDPELVWTALAGPPPPWSDIVTDVRPIVGGGWQNPLPVARALRADDPVPTVRSSGLQPLGSLWGDRGGFGLPSVSAGWVVEMPTRVVAVFRTDQPGVAQRLVEKRNEKTQGGGYLLTAGALEGDLEMDRGTLPRLDDRQDVALTLRLDLSPKSGIVGGYHERWVATEYALALVVTRGKAGAGGDDDALDALLDQLPKGPMVEGAMVDLPVLGPWLDGLRARKATVELTPGPQWRLLDAGIAWQRGELAPCGAAFGEVLVPGILRHPEDQAAQAYVCAAAAHETATADRAAVFLGPLPAIPAAIHARGLVDEGRIDDALAILGRTTPTTAEEGRVLTATRVQVAEALRAAGRTTDATQVLATACASSDGPPPEACGSAL